MSNYNGNLENSSRAMSIDDSNSEDGDSSMSEWDSDGYGSSDYDSDDSHSEGGDSIEEWDESMRTFQQRLNQQPGAAAIMLSASMVNLNHQQLLSSRDHPNARLVKSDSAPTFTMPPELLSRIEKAECVVPGAHGGHSGEGLSNIPTSEDILAQFDNHLSSPAVKPTVVHPVQAATNISPQEHLDHLLEQLGVEVRSYEALDLPDFFLKIEDHHVAGYNLEKATAIRRDDLDALRQLHRQGQSLQVCNRFGESIAHAACRRGAYDIVKFMIEEAHITLKVIDDYGRTPLADACWTQEPCFDLISLLLDHCPDLLLIRDKRGCFPLQYARRDHWDQWIAFLNQRKEKLMPRELSGKP